MLNCFREHKIDPGEDFTALFKPCQDSDLVLKLFKEGGCLCHFLNDLCPMVRRRSPIDAFVWLSPKAAGTAPLTILWLVACFSRPSSGLPRPPCRHQWHHSITVVPLTFLMAQTPDLLHTEHAFCSLQANKELSDGDSHRLLPA